MSVTRRKLSQYSFSYSDAELRATLLNSWEAFDIVGLADEERRFFSDLWGELASVVSVEAWRSATALAGQLLEAAFKHRLVMMGVARAELTGRGGTFGRLIGRGKQLLASLRRRRLTSQWQAVFSQRHR